MVRFKYKPLGDSGVLVIIGDIISPEISAKVRAFSRNVEAAKLDGVIEAIPAYVDVLVLFNPLKVSLDSLLFKLKALEKDATSQSFGSAKTLIVPVCYQGEYAKDKEEVCSNAHLSFEQVIEIHTAPDYLIYMLGFTPGFCYLGGLDKRIATPRKQTPRHNITAGAVGIAGEQTGIYPISSPGGWQIIGQTPIKMFHPKNDNPFLVQQGDFIRFKSIQKKEFEEVEREIENETYTYEFL